MNSRKTLTQRLVSGGLWATAGKIVAAISALLINMLLTHLLPPSEVGAYYLLMSIIFICVLVSQLGVQQAIVRLVAGVENITMEPTVRSSVISSVVIIGCATIFVSVLYYSVLGEWLGRVVFNSSYVAETVGLVVFIIILRAIQLFISQLFRGFHNIGLATIFEGTSTGVFLLSILIVFWTFSGYATLNEVLVSTIAALIVTVVLALILVQKPYRKTMPGEGINIGGVLSVSLPLFIAATTVPGFAEAHIWILGGAGDENAVAIYGVAYRLAKFVVVPLLIINSVIPPMIAHLVATNQMKKAEDVLRATALVAGIPSVVVVLLLFTIGDGVLSALFGDFYSQGYGVLMVLVIAQAVNALTGSPGVLLMMSSRQSVVMRFAIISGTLGVVVSFILVDYMSYLGVALGVSVGLVLNNVGMWFYCRKALGISTHMGFKKVGHIILFINKKFGIKN